MSTIIRVDLRARVHALGFYVGECLAARCDAVISPHGKVVAEANSGGTRATSGLRIDARLIVLIYT